MGTTYVRKDSDVLKENGLVTVENEVERVFNQVEADLPDDFQPVLCHNDFTPDNISFQDSEDLGILDFDHTCSRHNQRDLVKAANGFWMHDPCGDWDVRATFYEGYRDVNELDRSFERNEPLYRVETLADTVVGLLTMDELSEYETEFYSEKILEQLNGSKRHSIPAEL